MSQAFTMNILKRSGPIMEPWGTPVKTCFMVDLASPICTNCLRFFRQLSNKSLALFVMP